MMRTKNESLRGQACPRCVVLLLVTLALLCGSVFAQLNQGSVAGNVLDSTSAAVPDAKITAVGVATGTKYETVSGGAGNYRLPNMRVGAYNITVLATGFKSTTSEGVVVEVGTEGIPWPPD